MVHSVSVSKLVDSKTDLEISHGHFSSSKLCFVENLFLISGSIEIVFFVSFSENVWIVLRVRITTKMCWLEHVEVQQF